MTRPDPSVRSASALLSIHKVRIIYDKRIPPGHYFGEAG